MDLAKNIDTLANLVKHKKTITENLKTLRSQQTPTGYTGITEVRLYGYPDNIEIDNRFDQELIDQICDLMSKHYSAKLQKIDLLLGLANEAVKKCLEQNSEDVLGVFEQFRQEHDKLAWHSGGPEDDVDL